MVAGSNLYTTSAPDGRQAAIPVSFDAASDPYIQLKDAADIRNYYQQEGYVVIRNLIPSELCDQARLAFEQEVKPFKGHIYRQTTANPEKNIFTEHGYVLNSLLNIQDLNNKEFPKFKKAGLSIITHKNLQEAVSTLLGDEGVLVQSMYYEGNPATWAHQDTYYLDSVELGRMTAAWIAVEDIQPGAGRFYIYPGSHNIDMAKNGGDFDIAFNHSRYKKLVVDLIKEKQLECRAPALRKGDVLFWGAKTMHGSLATSQPEASRCSFTAHFIPASTDFILFQKKLKPLDLRKVNAVQIHCPKDQNKVKNKAVFYVETRFPKTFQFLKRRAIKLLLG
ncbi:MAG TPA: phytanoyl-CoA dioxygenase family protein [Candidatus Caenarcaniphilales bacterium]